MPHDHVQERAQQALIATQGDVDAAQKLLVAWAVRDQELLLGLAKSHLKALALAALEQAGKQMITPANQRAAPLPPETLTRLMNQPGVRRYKTAPPELEDTPLLDPERQAQTWQAIAKSFKKKKED